MTKEITRVMDINIEPSVKEIAESFCEMDSMEQADFFNCVAAITSKWDKQFCFQLQAITSEQMLTKEARKIMSEIGEYAAPF